MTISATTPGKQKGLEACTDDTGIIAALAMDQRGSLRRALAKAGGKQGTAIPDSDLVAFKEHVSRVLTPHASAILLDPLYGLAAASQRAGGTGLITAYEKSGYDADDADRIPALLPDWTAAGLAEAGADAVKVLVYFDPDGPADVNDEKRAFVERIGSECAEADMPFFLEPVTYAPAMQGPDAAESKPERVRATIAEFTQPRYRVDVLKVEIPVAPAWLDEASLASTAHRERVLTAFRNAGQAATRPMVFLSAGVDMEVFLRSLRLAHEAGTRFNGVLCGRATWKGGLEAFARGGAEALRAWLANDGVANIAALNATLAETARPL